MQFVRDGLGSEVLGVDALGLLLAVQVTAVSVSDNAGGIHLLSQIATTSSRVTAAWVDTGDHQG